MGKHRRGGSPRDTRLRKLHYEALEDRRLLAVVTVDTPLDVIDFTDGVTSLREAIFATNLVGGHDEIVFDFGHDGPETILLEHGELQITDSLTITSPGAALLTIDAQLQSRIFSITSTAGDVAVGGVTLRRGAAYLGGGVLAETSGTLTIENCVITDNHALGQNLRTGFFGGGIRAHGKVILQNSIVSHNTSYGSGGGVFSLGDVEVVDSLVNYNEVVDQLVVGDPTLQGGGGINAAGNVTLHQSRVEGNQATWSGGGIAAGGDISLIDSIVTANRIDGAGGGIYVGGHLLVERSTISDNHADGTPIPSPGPPIGPLHDGGGVFAQGDVTIRDSTISGNTSTSYGGGIIIIALGEASITNSTISGNSAPRGGGIAVFSAHVAVAHTTITGNHADEGGGVYVWLGYPPTFSILGVSHSIVADNTAASGPDIRSRAMVSADHVLIGDNSGTPVIEAPVGAPDSHGNLVGTVNNPIDSLLGPLADNGGPTLTHALLPDSPAINRGDLNAHAGMGSVPQFDQRGDGFPRIFGGRIDIGAFEYQAPSDLNLLVDTLVDESDGDHGRGDLSLREAIELANMWPGHDTIEFDSALVGGTILLEHGELAITDDLTINGLGADLLTIDASGNDPTPEQDNGDGSRILNVIPSATGLEFELSRLTLRGGDMTLNQGGAIYAPSQTDAVRLLDCVVTDNAAFYGGAIYSNNLEVKRTHFSDNEAAAGGAIIGGNLAVEECTFADNRAEFTGGAISYGGNATIVGTEFLRNYAGTNGGAIDSFGPLSIRDSVFRGNEGVNRGGAISTSGSTIFEVHSSIFEGNVSTQRPNNIIGVGGKRGGEGGAIFVGSHFYIHIVDSQIIGNRATGRGGGVSLSGREILIERTTISGNRAVDDGGGIYNFNNELQLLSSLVSGNSSGENGGGIASLFGIVKVQNSTVRYNTADIYGGGVWADFGDVVIQGSTLDHNTAARGGGIFAKFGDVGLLNSTVSTNIALGYLGGGVFTDFGSVNASHSTVTKNTAEMIRAGIASNKVVTLDHSIVAGNYVSSGAASDLDGVVNASYSIIGFVIELLAPLADNGGPTLTHALLPGSPAINAGDPNFVGPPTSDQRGLPYKRVSGGRIDIGAFEAQPLPGDLDGDADADGDDLALWESGYGTHYSGLDFLAWQITYQPPAPSPVLSPTLVDLAMAATLQERRPAAITHDELLVEGEPDIEFVSRESARDLAPIAQRQFDPWRSERIGSDEAPAERDDDAVAIAFDEVFAEV